MSIDKRILPDQPIIPRKCSHAIAGSCLINNPKPETSRMRLAFKAGLRSFAEAEKVYTRELLDSFDPRIENS
jgi:hypothetical protein